ncbi:protein translocase subunit SecE [Methylopila jiangsuensis]|uniref:Protein translocase subunit SecE n=1 Tax=Methylopila jiangsuensis TaxID=586230 RepID=A0A9W6JHW3_9HYPH|nr:preprotein translocase subunit SecE [Methylopila jiangsuensis]MDR6284353.1 preprotein translocase subunit SecE [Methylopila jiangsuensis]GLK76130.1 protein translocase subunit SecE [Methylopila jiangsuensis]
MAKTNPIEFLQEVGAETAKVVWPTRRETAITTIMVFVFVFLACVFFFLADMILRTAVTMILGFGQ